MSQHDRRPGGRRTGPGTGPHGFRGDVSAPRRSPAALAGGRLRGRAGAARTGSRPPLRPPRRDGGRAAPEERGAPAARHRRGDGAGVPALPAGRGTESPVPAPLPGKGTPPPSARGRTHRAPGALRNPAEGRPRGRTAAPPAVRPRTYPGTCENVRRAGAAGYARG